ncbi:hypothetical protein DFH07DRAFT_946994 [Mycena maculata]|uniref:Uncharacterized protein n=1 Tax=Mycena maculata TaxID=230809 RepID=A0AAD7HHU2_9AGAR|nr:hypothetical protein DFH07DRAFT_946994 [Mycena maculata]
MSSTKIISEIIRIAVEPTFKLASPAFARLRATSVAEGGVREQYYGFPQGERRHLCWVIQWPQSGPLQTASFRDELKALDAKESPVSWLVPFDDASQPRRALVAHCAQLCTVPLKPGTDVHAPALAASLHKTYSDCYEAAGFTGGYWGPALASNNSESERELQVNWYYLGWETRAAHDAYAGTPLFWLELNNLAPYMEGGEAEYYTFTQQLD